MSKVDELAKRICDGSWEGDGGKEFYERFLDEIHSIGRIEFLAAYMRDSEVEDVRVLMLSLPQLWQDFTVDDWLKLMEAVGEKPTKRPKWDIGEMGIFSDVLFLCRFLEINGLDLYLNYAKVSEQSKWAVVKYMQAFAGFFAKQWIDDYDDLSEGEDNVFDGFTLADLDCIKQNLLKDPRVKEFPQDETKVREYIEEIYSNFKQSLQTI